MVNKRKLSNTKIREYMKEKGVTIWKIADYLHIPESTLRRNFRYELQDEEREKIIKAVDAIATEV